MNLLFSPHTFSVCFLLPSSSFVPYRNSTFNSFVPYRNWTFNSFVPYRNLTFNSAFFCFSPLRSICIGGFSFFASRAPSIASYRIPCIASYPIYRIASQPMSVAFDPKRRLCLWGSEPEAVTLAILILMLSMPFLHIAYLLH